MEASQLLALRTGRVPGWEYDHRVIELGELRVPSGRLEASDPFVNLGGALVFTVPPGDYPVAVTIADVSEEQDGSHLRETYLSVRLAEGAPTKVTFLVPEGRDPLKGEDEYYGVPVDAGTVGFADAEAVKRYMPAPAGVNDPDGGNWYDDVYDTGEPDSWFALMDSPDHLIEGCANIVLPLAPDGENVVLSHSGWGDGFYPVLGAHDADGNLLSVHIDLQVDQPEGEEELQEDEPEAAAEPKPTFWRRLFGRS